MQGNEIQWFPSEHLARNFCNVIEQERLVVHAARRDRLPWGGATIEQLFRWISLSPADDRHIRVSRAQAASWRSRLACSIQIPPLVDEINAFSRINSVIASLRTCTGLKLTDFHILQEDSNHREFTIIFTGVVLENHACVQMLVNQSVNNTIVTVHNNDDAKADIPDSVVRHDGQFKSIVDVAVNSSRDTFPCWSCGSSLFHLHDSDQNSGVMSLSQFKDTFPFVEKTTQCTLDEDQCIRIVARQVGALLRTPNTTRKVTANDRSCVIM